MTYNYRFGADKRTRLIPIKTGELTESTNRAVSTNSNSENGILGQNCLARDSISQANGTSGVRERKRNYLREYLKNPARLERKRWQDRERLANRRKEYLAIHGPCVDCGSDLHLEIDHNDPSDKISHRVWSWPPERRAVELAKCSVRCRKCHRARHRKGVEHGTTSMYRYGCRCAECRAANTERRRRQRMEV